MNTSMSQFNLPQSLATDFDNWITEQILKLSTDTLSSKVLTCTACTQSASGKYIIEYQGETFRYSPSETYAFLKFVTEHLKLDFIHLGSIA